MVCLCTAHTQYSIHVMEVEKKSECGIKMEFLLCDLVSV